GEIPLGQRRPARAGRLHVPRRNPKSPLHRQIGQYGPARAGVLQRLENRGRMAEMITAAQEVSCLPCAHALEAEVREIRLIGELAPPYNRRSKNPERNSWIVLSDELFPRLSVVRSDS